MTREEALKLLRESSQEDIARVLALILGPRKPPTEADIHLTRFSDGDFAARERTARESWKVARELVTAAGIEVPRVHFHPRIKYPNVEPQETARTHWTSKRGQEGRPDFRYAPRVMVNLRNEYWDDPVKWGRASLDQEVNSTDHPAGVLIHELGHVVLHPLTQDKIVAWAEDRLSKDAPVSVDDAPEVARKVGRYASTSPFEFLAEVFAGLVTGRTFDEDVMKFYRWLGGKVPTKRGKP